MELISASPAAAPVQVRIEVGSDLESVFLELTGDGAGAPADGPRSLGSAG